MRSTGKIAIGGVLGALALVTLLLTVFPYATFALPALAGIWFIPLIIECNKRTALSVYAAVALLSLLILPDREAAVLFVLFFGYYPVVKSVAERLPNRVWEWVVKVAVFNAAMVAAYALLILLGLPLSEFELFGAPIAVVLAVFLALGNAVFVLYDIAVTRLISLYLYRVRSTVQRLFRL